MPEQSNKSQAVAVGLTILVLVGVLILTRRNQKPGPVAEGPEAAVWSVFDASKNGDVRTYLSCFTDDLERTLRKTAEMMTEPKFADYLKQTNRAVKGFVVSDINQPRADEATLKVELVYQDKNEVQEYYLKRVGSAWKVRDVRSTERVRTLVPYGTEVTPLMEK